MATTNLDIILKAIYDGRGIKQAKKDLEDTVREGGRFRDTLMTGIGAIKEVGAAAAIMGGVFKTAFDLAEQGAAIQRTEERLDRLAATIGTTADALQTRMGEATRGLVSDAELAASAGQIISLGLAKSEDSVVRLATVISTLGLDMNQVILTFANNSVMRLDALGLAVDDVRERAARLEAEGLDANAAFDTAVLEALEAKMQLLGGGIDDNAAAFKRLRTEVTNLTDAFKTWLAEGLTPAVAALGGTNAGIFTRMAEGQREAADTLRDYIEAGKGLSEAGSHWLGLGVVVAGVADEHHAALTRVAQDIAAASGSYEEFQRAFNQAFDWNARYSIFGGLNNEEDLRRLYDAAVIMERMGDALSNAYQPATSQATTSTAGLAAAAEDASIAIRDGTGAIVGYVGMINLLGTGAHTTALSARELAGATHEARDAAAESLPEIKSAFEEVFGATDAARDMLERYKGLLSSGETAEQRLAIVNLAEAWGIVTGAEAEAQRQVIEMEETHNRIVNNMAVVINTNLAGGWHNAWSAANSYRDLLLQLEGITPPTPGGFFQEGMGGSPYDSPYTESAPPPPPPPNSDRPPPPSPLDYGPVSQGTQSSASQTINIYLDSGGGGYMQVQGQVTATAGLFAQQLGVPG